MALLRGFDGLKMTNADLQEDLNAWDEVIRQAFLRFENRLRQERQLRPFPDTVTIHVPSGPRSTLQLLNWKIWCTRYSVSVDFIMETLLFCYARCRRLSKKENEIQLGLASGLLTGSRARQLVEEAVARAYPNGENYKVAHQPKIPLPVDNWDYDSPEDFTVQYAATMDQRQRNPLKERQRIRNFRRV
jgi:hypothetical protein